MKGKKWYTCIVHLPWIKFVGLKVALVVSVSGELMWRPIMSFYSTVDFINAVHLGYI